jgi:septal ring factor EnvC (AmiA/AmiB activator)
MRSLPVDQNGDLVVRVVRATLASLNVHLPEIIEDASRKQKATQERIAAVHKQIADLEKQLEAQRKEVAGLEADLKETTTVKERLQLADKSLPGANLFPPRSETPASVPAGQPR